MRLVLALFLFCTPLLGVDDVPINFVKHPVLFWEGLGRFNFYVVRPRHLGVTVANSLALSHFIEGASARDEEFLKKNEEVARSYLNSVANLVDADARAKGYINDNTRSHHEHELALLRSGRWPTIFVTPENSDEILLTLSYAIRWDDEPLPFERRFFGKGIEGLADELPVLWQVAFQERFRTLSLYRGGVFKEKNALSLPTVIRPWIEGEVAEIKFLVSPHRGTFDFIPVIHKLSKLYELHRFSMRPCLAEHLGAVEKFGEREEVKKLVEFAVERMTQHWRPQTLGDIHMFWSMQDFFRAGLFLPQWQPTVANSKLYVHVSGRKGQDSDKGTWAKRQFVKRFGFPEPKWGFDEPPKVGTKGIWTDLFELPVDDYEIGVEQGLSNALKFEFEQMATVSPAELVNLSKSEGANCALLLSHMDHGLQQYILYRAIVDTFSPEVEPVERGGN